MDIFESFESQDPLSRFRAWTNERFLRYRLWGSIGLSLFLGAGASQLWEQVLLFLNQKSFGVTDPIFDADVSSFVFGLPLYRLFVSWGFQFLHSVGVGQCALLVLHVVLAALALYLLRLTSHFCGTG